MHFHKSQKRKRWTVVRWSWTICLFCHALLQGFLFDSGSRYLVHTFLKASSYFQGHDVFGILGPLIRNLSCDCYDVIGGSPKMQEKVSASRLHHSIAHVLKHLTMLLSYTIVCAGIRKHSAKFVVCMTLTMGHSNLSPLLSQL